MYSGTVIPADQLHGRAATAAALPFHVHIIGPKKSGKSRFALLLAERLGMPVAETSAFLMDEAAILCVTMFPDRYATIEAAREELARKEPSDRIRLASLGDMMTALRRDCLIAGAIGCAPILSGAIVVGARRKIELEGWFGSIYAGWKHTADVLIEIVDPTTEDTQYELAGWHHRHPGAVKFAISAAESASWESFADRLAGELRKL